MSGTREGLGEDFATFVCRPFAIVNPARLGLKYAVIEGVHSMRRTFRYRLDPTKAQAETLDAQLGLCRELYNAAIEERRDAWRIAHRSVGFNQQSAQLPEIKAERPELEGVDSQVLQDVLHRVDKNFKAFFRRRAQGEKPGFPRFRPTSRYDSLTYPQLGVVVEVRHLKLSKNRPTQTQVASPN